MKPIFSIIFLVGYTLLVVAQSEHKVLTDDQFLDSLESINDNYNKIDFLYRNHNNISNDLLDSMTLVLEPIAKKSRNPESLGDIYYTMATHRVKMGQYDEFYDFLQKANNLYQNENNLHKSNKALKGIAYYYTIKREKQKAKDIYLRLIKYFKANGDYEAIANIYLSIANLYMYPISLPEFTAANDSLKVYIDKSGQNPLFRYNYFLNKNLIYNTENKSEDIPAIEDSIISIIPKLNNYYQANAYGRLGSMALQNAPHKALQYMIKSDSIYLSLNNVSESRNIRGYIAQIAININDYDTARSYFENTIHEYRGYNTQIYLISLSNLILLNLEEGRGSLDENIALTDTILSHITPEDDLLKLDAYILKSCIYYNENDLTLTRKYLDTIFAFKNKPLNNFYPEYLTAELLLRDGKYQEAKRYSDQSKNSSLNNNSDEKKWIKQRILLMGKLGYKDEVIHLQNRYIALQDSVFSMQNRVALKNIEERYRNDLKTNKIKELQLKEQLVQEKLSSANNTIWASVIGLGILGTLLYFLYRQNAARRKTNTLLKEQKEKTELLYTEMNHRVKNNLAFMTSLLEMQGRRTQNKKAIKVIRESETRLKTLSILHDKLYESDDDTTVNLATYMRDIIDYSRHIFTIPEKTLTISDTIEDCEMDPEDAMRIGLIVNEMITNSIKHAFKDVTNPTIKIAIHKKEETLSLVYSDNGPGFDIDAIYDRATTSKNMGAKLISMLVQQLEAKINQDSDTNEIRFRFTSI